MRGLLNGWTWSEPWAHLLERRENQADQGRVCRRGSSDLGCKGCTTYRPNDVTGAVLETKKTDTPENTAEPELPLSAPTTTAHPMDEGDSGAVVYMTQPLDRPEALVRTLVAVVGNHEIGRDRLLIIDVEHAADHTT